jgi:hypothetical protein
MPVAHNGAHLYNRLRDTQLDQHDDSGCFRNGRRGMHHNAKRALVGIVTIQVNMSHLNNGNQRHQDQAHNQPCRRGILGVTPSLCLISRQFSNLSLYLIVSCAEKKHMFIKVHVR